MILQMFFVLNIFQNIYFSLSSTDCICSENLSTMLRMENEECFDPCFFQKITEGELQKGRTDLDAFFDIYRENMLEIFQTRIETSISLSLEAESIFSLYGRKNFSCSLGISVLLTNPHSCFATDNTTSLNVSNYTDYGSINRETVIKVTGLLPLSPKFKISCNLYGNYSTSYEFYPLTLKSPPGKKAPANDMALTVSSHWYTKYLLQLDFAWKCPLFWAGLPNKYLINCSAELQSSNREPATITVDWAKQNLRDSVQFGGPLLGFPTIWPPPWFYVGTEKGVDSTHNTSCWISAYNQDMRKSRSASVTLDLRKNKEIDLLQITSR